MPINNWNWIKMASRTDITTHKLLVVHCSSHPGCCSPSIINDKREREALTDLLASTFLCWKHERQREKERQCVHVCVCSTVNTGQDTWKVEFPIQKTNMSRLTLTVDQYRYSSVKGQLPLTTHTHKKNLLQPLRRTLTTMLTQRPFFFISFLYNFSDGWKISQFLSFFCH